ncbi:MAG TPA: branched-chain amino acid ABC transporter permease [Thermopetrobacter sp.]|nr:branched-chain amino acid ABC transporter permease [Thermopetrobacter sp.]
MIAEFADALVQGLLLGGLYALFAAGLSLLFGIIRFVNLAHGDFIILAAYLGLMLVEATGLHPLLALLVVPPFMAALGYAGQRLLLNRVVERGLLPAILVTFGLSIIIQNLLLEVFSANARRVPAGALDVASVALPGGINVGVLPLVIFAAAVLALGGLGWFFRHTMTGRLLRAVSDDPPIVGLIGADRRHLFAVATAIAALTAGLAGVLLMMKTNFDPAAGPARLLFAFEAVIIGGLRNLWGTLAGGMILGIAQGIGARIDPGWQLLAGHLVFLLVLAVRPRGLFGGRRR